MAKEFDLIIIGGGIIGAACALEATCAGLSVLLLEKGDFGSETSAGSFKIVHGGLRYLQHLDFSRLKESYKEQQFLRKSAPQLLKPLPFIVPCYGFGLKGRAALRLTCSIYETLSISRNEGIEDALKLPDHRVLSKEEVVRIAPSITQQGLRGGVVFYDCQMQNPDRLTLAVVTAAENRGAIVRNYHEVVKIKTKLTDSGVKEIAEIVVSDLDNGFQYSVTARAYINALGPAASQIGRLFDEVISEQKIPELILSKGIQLTFPEVISNYALSVEGRGRDTASNVTRGGRAFFLQPWKGGTLAGTTDTIVRGGPNSFKIGLPEIKLFLKDLYDAYPSQIFKPINVRYAFGGLRPIDPKVSSQLKKGMNRDGMVNTSRDEEIINHSSRDYFGLGKISNLISVSGIKYTTFRSVSERVVSQLKKLSITGNRFVFDSGLSKKVSFNSGEEVPDLQSLMEISLEQGFKCKQSDLLDLIECYGGRAKHILDSSILNLKKFNLEPQNALRLSRTEFAIKYEHTKHLTDLIMRRMPLSVHGFPGHQVVEEISKYAAHHLGWDEGRRLSEIRTVNEKFTFEVD